jgi:hypothetical protein
VFNGKHNGDLDMTQIFSKQESPLLSAVPMGKEFRFYNAQDASTDITANSLEDFAEKLKTVDADTILFHYPRGDFQAWIKDVIGDNLLADRLCFIRRNLSGERLRQEVLRIIQKRLDELKTP